MADIEDKLNMSLDALAEKDRLGRHRAKPAAAQQRRSGGKAGGASGSGGGGGGGAGRHRKQRDGRNHRQHGGGYAHNHQGRGGGHGGSMSGAAGGAHFGHQQFGAQMAHRTPVMPTQQPRYAPPTDRYGGAPPLQQPAAAPPVARVPALACNVDPDSGAVVITHVDQEIVKVGPAGDVTLNAGGQRSASMAAALNTALAPLGMSVSFAGADPSSSQWSVSDGRGLRRYEDGIILPSKGPLTAGRAMLLLQAFSRAGGKAAAAAAASTAAAVAAGLLPGRGQAGGDAVAVARRLQAQGRFAPY